MFSAALVAVFVVLGATAPASAPLAEQPPQCAKVRDHNRYARYVLRYSARNGDYHASTVTDRQLGKLGAMRSCAKHTDRGKYRLMRGAWNKRRTSWAFHRHIDQITVYGKWAIPEYIVMRESGGDACAKNPQSTAAGYYQFLSSTWAAYGGTGGTAMCAPPWEQHEVAARAWDGGRGQSHWALTA